jgi:FkbH-like protein
LDLDNTLWGGVVGEEGVDGIQLGPNYPGNAFMEFQRGIQGLRARGIVLGLASKNNPQDVDEVFATHASMVLGRGDFAAVEVHWEPKSESLQRIAKALNIGLDHIVFADDNPAECEHVRLLLPAVTVIQLPPRPEDYVKALFEDGWFDALSLSGEDLQRSALYERRAQAEILRESTSDLAGFYRDLDMVLSIAPVHAKTLGRVAQLTMKTNQFNATTRRYTEAEVARRMGDPAWTLLAVSVADRFGDNGLVGVIMAFLEDGVLTIDTFLLSCRVIGRTVETAMLAQLCEVGSSGGAKSLRGVIVPTPKNEPARDLFERHGFTQESVDGDGVAAWLLNLETSSIPCPEWFKRVNQ